MKKLFILELPNKLGVILFGMVFMLYICSGFYTMFSFFGNDLKTLLDYDEITMKIMKIIIILQFFGMFGAAFWVNCAKIPPSIEEKTKVPEERADEEKNKFEKIAEAIFIPILSFVFILAFFLGVVIPSVYYLSYLDGPIPKWQILFGIFSGVGIFSLGLIIGALVGALHEKLFGKYAKTVNKKNIWFN